MPLFFLLVTKIKFIGIEVFKGTDAFNIFAGWLKSWVKGISSSIMTACHDPITFQFKPDAK